MLSGLYETPPQGTLKPHSTTLARKKTPQTLAARPPYIALKPKLKA